MTTNHHETAVSFKGRPVSFKGRLPRAISFARARSLTSAHITTKSVVSYRKQNPDAVCCGGTPPSQRPTNVNDNTARRWARTQRKARCTAILCVDALTQ